MGINYNNKILFVTQVFKCTPNSGQTFKPKICYVFRDVMPP